MIEMILHKLGYEENNCKTYSTLNNQLSYLLVDFTQQILSVIRYKDFANGIGLILL